MFRSHYCSYPGHDVPHSTSISPFKSRAPSTRIIHFLHPRTKKHLYHSICLSRRPLGTCRTRNTALHFRQRNRVRGSSVRSRRTRAVGWRRVNRRRRVPCLCQNSGVLGYTRKSEDMELHPIMVPIRSVMRPLRAKNLTPNVLFIR